MSKNCEHGNPKCESCRAERFAILMMVFGALLGLALGFLLWGIRS